MSESSSAPAAPTATARKVRLCLWCVVAVIIELGLYLSYRGHDARFHWFTHFFVGSAVALLVMSAVALHNRRPVPVPLVWPVLGHLYAMFPDLLFSAGHVAHQRWMDVFLGHITTHFVPGRNLTWYVAFLAATAVYLGALHRLRSRER
jgi:4-hydroxybenzoate polyprenyltransferase